MVANATVLQFVEDLGAMTPVIVAMIQQVLSLLLAPPLVIFTSIAVIYAGFRIGMRLWHSLSRQ